MGDVLSGGDVPGNDQASVPTGYWERLLGGDTDLIWASSTMGRIFGVRIPENGCFPARTLADLIPQQDKVYLSIKELVEEGTVHDMEFEIAPADGRPHRLVHSVAEIVRNASGKEIKIMGTVQDITDIVTLDTRMQRLNRELLAIKECARAVMFAKSERELWDSVCRIICQVAGYRLAWVGLAEDNERKDIRPVAWSGHDEEYVRNIRATWGDDERGQGPAGMCIKSGRTFFIQDVKDDRRYDPWQEYALRNGYRSVIAIPLMDNGAAFGALMMYSEQNNGFTGEEVELLEDMASDLAFGSVTLRVRREREKAMTALGRVEARNRALYELAQLTGVSSRDLTKRALSSCIALSESRIGFIAFLSEDGTDLIIQHWSEHAMAECRMADRPYHFKVKDTGLWTESLRQRRAVITNDYNAPHPSKKGLPPGHSPIERYISVPVFDRGRIVAMLGVGNKESDYTEEDAADLSILLDGMWRIVSKIQAEEELKEHHGLLNTLTENIPDAVYIKDREGRYLMMNSSTGRVLGMDPQDALGKDDLVLMGPETGNSVMEDDREVMRIQRARSFDTNISVLGRQRSFSSWKAPYLSSEGEVIGIMGISRDVTVSKRAEEALRRSEQMLKIVIDHFPGLVFWKDRELTYLGANQASARSSGFDGPEDLVGKNDYDLPWARSEADEYRADDRLVMDRGEPRLHIQESHQGHEGKVRWLDTSKIPLRDEDGNVFGILGVAIDITEKKGAEDALRQANLIVENSPVMLFRWRADEGWPVELVSNNVTHLGYRPQQFLDGSILYASIIHPEDQDRVNEMVMDMASKGVDQYAQTYRVRTAEGNVRWVDERTTAERDAQGHITHFHGIVFDITERKEAEIRLHAINQALQEGEEKYHQLFELGNEAIFLVDDLSGRLLETNTASSDLYGYSQEELRSMTEMDLMAEHERSQPYMSGAVHSSNGGISIPLRHHRKKYGREFPVEINGRSFIWNERNVHVAAVRDISERMRNEDALRQMNKKLNLLNSITRHDLNNQMTALTNNLALMEMKRTDPSLDTYIQRSLASADSISAIMRFTETYEEIGVRAPEWQNLKGQVAKSAGEIPPTALRVVNDLPAGVEVFADPLIQKVFYNLIDNASRYGVTVRNVRFYMERRNDTDLIVCEDDGVGIGPDMKGKLFTRGFGKNHGLGLFLSREILAITGITIAEESESGKGARFVLSVPKGGIRGLRG